MCGGGGISGLTKFAGFLDPGFTKLIVNPGIAKLGSLFTKKPAAEAEAPPAQTVTTNATDPAALAAVQKKKPRSLLSQAGAAGDLGGADIGTTFAKPTLGA